MAIALPDMPLLAYILIFTTVGSIFGLIGGLFLIWKEKFAKKISMYLLAFAAGTLLAAVFFHLLPELTEHDGVSATVWMLIGIVLFFMIEKLLIWQHGHLHIHKKAAPYHLSKKTYGYLAAIGDTVHNFIDGLTIGVTFLVSIPLGIIASIAVFFHEVPQEIGDFSIMIYSGWNKRKILWISFLSACATYVGALLVYFLSGDIMHELLVPFLGLAAGNFTYIALSDIVPVLKHETDLKKTIWQMAILIAGILLMYGIGVALAGTHVHMH